MEYVEQIIALSALGISSITTIVGWFSLRKKTSNGGSKKTTMEFELQIIELERKVLECELLCKEQDLDSKTKIMSLEKKLSSCELDKNRLVTELINIKSK